MYNHAMKHTSIVALSLFVTRIAFANPPAADFAEEARSLWRIVACGTTVAADRSPVKERPSEHCAALRSAISSYQARWLERATPILANIVPRDIPKTVVYPFGGGDLLTALATYPEATEITTLSLERAGDPRSINRLRSDPALGEILKPIRKRIVHLFRLAHSLTREMGHAAKHELLPDQLVFALVALAVHGYEPSSLRYFRLEADGTPHYYTLPEIAAAQRRNKPNPAFTNMELVFKAHGHNVTYRHFGANLDDQHLRATPSLIKHLELKGRVAAMTKAASYTLWWPNFSIIRNYLLHHMDWMISDSTGIPPGFAQRAGFEYETYGRFDGPFFPNRKKEVEAWRAIWQAQPRRNLPFLYGYPDSEGHTHLVVTRRVRHAS